MSIEDRPLLLPRDPASARTARAWVTDRLHGLGRDDLVDTAVLGVSELVTNAILHTESQITVQLRGTADHPRIEVRDSSKSPPRMNAEMTEDEFLLSTVGRGLGLLAAHAATWGSEIDPQGKLVWFEPAREARTDGDLAGEVYDIDELVEDLLASTTDLEQRIPIRLRDMPVRVFAHYRNSYNGLLRELRLVALTEGTDHPLARMLSEVAVEVERDRRQSYGVEQLDRALEAGQERADLEYLVPPGTPAHMARMRDLLEEADEFCREQRLLTVAPGPQEIALRRWYLGEFARQGAGQQPIPWQGGFEVDDPRG